MTNEEKSAASDGGPQSPTTEDLFALFAAVCEQHRTVTWGMTHGAPDVCSCGVRTLPERGEEDVDVRRRRAVAQHQAEALVAALAKGFSAGAGESGE